MSSLLILSLLAVGIACLGGAVYLRAKSAGKYEIKPTDLALIVVPLLAAGLVTGKIGILNVMGISADVTALREAGSSSVEAQVSAAASYSLENIIDPAFSVARGAPEGIPRLVEQGVDVLEFSFGFREYSAAVIAQHFHELSLRYVVVNNANGSLYGIYVAGDLLPYLDRTNVANNSYSQFVQQLNRGGADDKRALAQLPGFIPVEWAVTSATSKLDALRAMADHEQDVLPVVDGEDRFIGTVEQPRLTASLILAVTE